jgi:hypothetical protein
VIVRDYRPVAGLVDVRGFGVLTAPGGSRIETQGLTELIERMGVAPKRISAIVQQTVNRAAMRTRTRVARAVRDEVRLKYGEALEKVTATKAYIAGGVTQAKVFAQKRGLMLVRYATNESAADSPLRARPRPTVAVGRDRSRKEMSYSFYVRLKNGRRAIATRRRGERKFDVLHGPSPSQIFDTYRPRIASEIGQWTSGELMRRIRYETGGKGQTLLPRGVLEAE